MGKGFKWRLFVLFVVSVCAVQAQQTDTVAENMLVYQRDNGGWSKVERGNVNYEAILTKTEKETLLKEKTKLDATIDNKITTREITYLISAYKNTQNSAYLKAAEKGVNYLLNAQYANGGWGQYFPDTSGYRKHITFNDNAMINVMVLLKKIGEKNTAFDIFSPNTVDRANLAVSKGVDCILKCQIKKDSTLTVWCAQHDRNTFLPTSARAFEPASYSGAESVGIVNFLMGIKNPNERIKTAINSAVEWFKLHDIKGINQEWLKDTNGKTVDRVVTQDNTSTLWARFYSLENAMPIFIGRDSIPKPRLEDIELERRLGYAYLGTWPKDLIEKDYPKWKSKL